MINNKLSYKVLKYCADLILDMGIGGSSIKENLITYAKNVTPGNCIIDIAPFIGSTTAYLSLGLIESSNDKSRIIAIDKWELTDKYKEFLKNKKYTCIAGLDYEFARNILPYEFEGVVIEKRNINISGYRHKGKKIGLVVDDICSGKKYTDHLLKSLSPYFIPNETILILMDYYWYKFRDDYKCRHYQKDIMELNKNVFEFIDNPKDSKTAIFKYLGGEIQYIEDESYNDYYLPDGEDKK